MALDSIPSWLQTSPQEWGNLAHAGAQLDIERQRMATEAQQRAQEFDAAQNQAAVAHQAAQEKAQQDFLMKTQQNNIAKAYHDMTIEQQKAKLEDDRKAKEDMLNAQKYRWSVDSQIRQQMADAATKRAATGEAAAGQKIPPLEAAKYKNALAATRSMGSQIAVLSAQAANMDPKADASKIADIKQRTASLTRQKSQYEAAISDIESKYKKDQPTPGSDEEDQSYMDIPQGVPAPAQPVAAPAAAPAAPATAPAGGKKPVTTEVLQRLKKSGLATDRSSAKQWLLQNGYDTSNL